MSCVSAQTATEVFPAVVYLQGHSGPQRLTIAEREGDLWVKYNGEDHPEPVMSRMSGSGFITQADDRLYLVTAEHVARGVGQDTEVILRGPNDTPLLYRLSDLVLSKPPKWIYHEIADVAVVALAPPPDFHAAIKAVNIAQIADSLVAPDIELYLTTIGFPLSLGLTGMFSPIVKTSHSASGIFRHKRFDNNKETDFYILEDPSVAGFSGALVVKLPSVRVGAMRSSQGTFECVGLVHGTFNDPTGGKFAAIVPGAYIRETILLAAQQSKPAQE
ncbi:MAG: hypothetical protein IIA61_08780 [Candidatus Marinimicrobia bacterium]|nr:hypothetical protein [Candidatus Neomarinimicrobiota bacterium]